MPTYEYRCKACGHELEAVQAFTDDPLTECSECGGALRKKFGAVGITFKGSGFYKTDSRSSGSSPGKVAAASGSDASGGDGGSAAAKGAESTSSSTEGGSDSSSGSSAGSSSSDSSSATPAAT